MPQQIQIRRGTAAAWTSANPTLAQGEIGLETDTGKIKVGDGSTAWASLSYFSKAQVGLSSVDDTADTDKPVSTAQQTALDAKANLAGGNSFTGAQAFGDGELSRFSASINDQSGTTYTLQASDNGKVVRCNNASAITVTLPNSLAVGFNCMITQAGAGQVTMTAGSGATMNNRQSHTKTAGQYAGVSLLVTGNSGGAAAVYLMIGDSAS